jgi:hypothetical protein
MKLHPEEPSASLPSPKSIGPFSDRETAASCFLLPHQRVRAINTSGIYEPIRPPHANKANLQRVMDTLALRNLLPEGFELCNFRRIAYTWARFQTTFINALFKPPLFNPPTIANNEAAVLDLIVDPTQFLLSALQSALSESSKKSELAAILQQTTSPTKNSDNEITLLGRMLLRLNQEDSQKSRFCVSPQLKENLSALAPQAPFKLVRGGLLAFYKGLTETIYRQGLFELPEVASPAMREIEKFEASLKDGNTEPSLYNLSGRDVPWEHVNPVFDFQSLTDEGVTNINNLLRSHAIDFTLTLPSNRKERKIPLQIILTHDKSDESSMPEGLNNISSTVGILSRAAKYVTEEGLNNYFECLEQLNRNTVTTLLPWSDLKNWDLLLPLVKKIDASHAFDIVSMNADEARTLLEKMGRYELILEKSIKDTDKDMLVEGVADHLQAPFLYEAAQEIQDILGIPGVQIRGRYGTVVMFKRDYPHYCERFKNLLSSESEMTQPGLLARATVVGRTISTQKSAFYPDGHRGPEDAGVTPFPIDEESNISFFGLARYLQNRIPSFDAARFLRTFSSPIANQMVYVIPGPPRHVQYGSAVSTGDLDNVTFAILLQEAMSLQEALEPNLEHLFLRTLLNPQTYPTSQVHLL